MRIIRLSKTAMVAAIAFFASLTAFGNITDYGTNWAFVQHVLSMDTIDPTATIRYRAIDNHVYDCVRHFLVRRHKVQGRGTQRFSHDTVFGELGVVHLRRLHIGPPSRALR